MYRHSLYGLNAGYMSHGDRAAAWMLNIKKRGIFQYDSLLFKQP